MSRHNLPSKLPGHTVTVGYDVPMQTYFATVTRDLPDDDLSDNLVLWLGATPKQFPRAEAMAARLRPFADLTPEILDQLHADRLAAPPPTPLQHAMIGLTHRRAR